MRRSTRELATVLQGIALALLAASCSEPATESPTVPVASTSTAARSRAASEREIAPDTDWTPADEPLARASLPEPGLIDTTAHARYLGDELRFLPVPDGGLPKGPTAVVGSRVCLFYPGAAIGSSADLGRLPEGVPVPFGTILAKGERVQDSGSDRLGMFQFQDHWNYFYETRWQGKEGLVFGADLYGLGDSNEANRVSSLLYLSGGRFKDFYPLSGYASLDGELARRLEADRLAFQAVSKGEYSLSLESADDMIALYQGLAKERKQPVFVTTDLAAHASHLVFDRVLQYVEEYAFMPRLEAMTDLWIEELERRTPGGQAEDRARDAALGYFKTARALLSRAPTRGWKHTDYGAKESLAYTPKEGEVIPGLTDAPPDVRSELALIDAAQGFANSSVLRFELDGQPITYREDYSQYKPRGHYTKNGILSAYFQAMMWYGRIHFLIAQPGEAVLAARNGQSSEAIELTLAMEPVALLLADMASKDSRLMQAWELLFEPVSSLIGASDDLSLIELIPLWEEFKKGHGQLGEILADRDKLLTFAETAHARLRPPAISGSSVFWGPSEGPDRKPPMGWRLFGQRFTLDSEIHHKVSPPRLMSRDMVRGLDVMKALGSKTADGLLAKSDYPAMVGLEERLDEIERELDSLPAQTWRASYYMGALDQVRAQARFEPGVGLYFTESPSWAAKAMNAAHGTWAELRHDTLLYVKQSYAERAGDGDYEPTFRTEPIPEPVHYIEPNLPFWNASVRSLELLYESLHERGLLDEESALAIGRLHGLYVRAARLAEAELRDEALGAADLSWIRSFAGQLVGAVLLHVRNAYLDDPEQLRMALVADVFTNAELGLALEVGVGIPRRLYVPLNDGQGGKRIAVGYGFSYYEFPVPMGERLTNETWKKKVYADEPSIDRYLPFWAQGLTLPPRTR